MGSSVGPNVVVDRRIEQLGTSPTLGINEQCAALAREGREIFRLGLGQSPFPVPATVVEALRDAAHRKEYLPVAGLPDLRAAVAEYHRRVDGLSFGAEDVLIGPGSKELMFLLQLALDADTLLPAPSWVSYVPQAQLVGRRVIHVETAPEQRWRLQPRALREAAAMTEGSTRLLILNYPGNPDGDTYDAAELEALAQVARELRMVVLSDEIYGPLHHRGAHVSIARYYPEGTIVSGGLSKWCGAGGWRLGTFAFPPALASLRRSMIAAASETFSAVTTPVQCAAVRAFAGGPEIERYLDDARAILAALGSWCATRLRAAGASVADPRGAFYLFVTFEKLREPLAARGITTDEALWSRALQEADVAFLPGKDFGVSSAALAARLAYVDFDGAAALAELADGPGGHAPDEDFLRRRCGKVLEGVERLCRWLEG